jgi:cell division protein FtsB
MGTEAMGSTWCSGLAARPRRYRLLTGILLLAGVAIGAAPAQAQTARSGGESARAMQELQQLAAERTSLQAENAKLKDQVADFKKKVDQLNTESAAANARAREFEAAAARGAQSSTESADALAKSRAQMQELIARFRETVENLKTVESDRNTLRGRLEIRDREYNTCIENNVGLYEVGRDALDRLDRQGFWTRVRESEPFTQLARARLDNLIDDYRQRLQELRLDQSKKAGPGKNP